MPARVVLGVGAGIAAYKSCELLRLLTESGHHVRVVPTPDALRFVGEATWAALSGQPVTTDAWTGVAEVPHVRLGQSADLVLVAPATADLMARAAAGMAGDLLTATLLTARCPVLYAPAMHTEMWEHPATQANVSLLRRRGAIVLEPAVGRLTGQDSGAGRLPEPAAIFAVATRLLARGRGPRARLPRGPAAPGSGRPPRGGLRGRHPGGDRPGAVHRQLVHRDAGVRAGPHGGGPRRRGDPGRGQRGAARSGRGQDHPGGFGARDARRRAGRRGLGGADAVVMAAAVADYRPEARSAAKIKKDGQPPEPLRLTENPDILAGLAAARRDQAAARQDTPDHDPERTGLVPPATVRQVLVGFAAETDTSPETARAKLARKGCDLLVVNPVGNGLGFGTPDNEAVVYGADGTVTPIPRGPKEALADVVWDLVAARMNESVSHT